MSVTPAEPTITPDPAKIEPPVATATPPAAPMPTEPPKVTEPAANLWEDPKAAETEIKRLRQENADYRVANRPLKEAAKAQVAEDAKREIAQTIGKALGLVEDETIDPAKLTESLTTSQAEAKQARVELAVFRNAATAGGDPAALLDSSSFLKSLDSIDPNDATAVAEAVKKAVEANPRLGVATSPRTPAPNPAQGASGGGAPLDFDQQIDAATKAGNFQQAIALKQQRAAALKAKS